MWKPIYASLTEMRDWVRIREAEDVDDDALLRLALSAASRAVDATCRRQFGKVDAPTTRVYDARWSRTLGATVVDVDDIMDTTGLTLALDDTTLASGQYEMRPLNAPADGKPYTCVVISATGIRLTGVGLWGWDAVPDVIKEAALLQASRLSIRRDSPYGVAGSPQTGSELRLLARLDPDITPIVTDYVRTGWVAR